MAEDKVTIGLTQDNKQVIEDIEDQFNEQMEAARFAMSHAIQAGQEPGDIENTETVWNVGSFDPDGEIRDLIRALFPEVEDPYRAAEYLINKGLQMIGDHVEEHKEMDVLRLIRTGDS